MNKIWQSILTCKKCELCNNQSPIVQSDLDRADVFWIGLSAVKVKNYNETPLSANTNSGKLIRSVESLFCNKVSFYKTNVVKCLPLQNDKIRYPSIPEMNNCYFNLEEELKSLHPKIIFLLGKQVAKFILKRYNIDVPLDENFNYHMVKLNNFLFIPIHHPSYILVYKRKRMSKYLQSLETIIKQYLQLND